MSIRTILLLSILFVSGAVADAQALGLKAQANVSGGLATVTVEDSDQDYTIGFGRGFGVGLLLDAGVLAAGPYFQYSAGGPHKADGSDTQTEFTVSTSAFGLVLKLNVPLVVLQLNAGYITGDATFERQNVSVSFDGSGYTLGVAAGFSIPIVPMFNLEVGPYVEYRQLKFEERIGIVTLTTTGNAFQFGLMLQAVFDLPI